MTPARRRRRTVVAVLVACAVVSLGLALLINPLLWVVHIVADIMLVTYLYLFFLVKRHGLGASSYNYFWDSSPDNRAVAVKHPRVPARRELAPMRRASKPRRSAAG